MITCKKCKGINGKHAPTCERIINKTRGRSSPTLSHRARRDSFSFRSCNQGPPGPPGPRGPRGSPGQMGPAGSTGECHMDDVCEANTWFVGTGCQTPDNAHREPIPGDYLLNLDNCEICQYREDGWTGTGQVLNCFKCDDVETCLKKVPNATGEVENSCTATLTAPDCSPIFNSGPISITEIVIADQMQMVPAGTFMNPTELASLLDPYWQYVDFSGVHVYVTQLILVGETEGTDSHISFSNGVILDLNVQCQTECPACDDFKGSSKVLICRGDQLFWVDSCCLLGSSGTGCPEGPPGETGMIGATGPQGPTGPHGPTGTITCDDVALCLNDLTVEETDCQYCGLYDPTCIDFLDNIVGTNSVALARGIVLVNAADFSDPITLQFALNSLGITIQNNVIKVTDPPEPIDRVIFYDGAFATGNIRAVFLLTPTKCCPTGVDSQTEVLTKLGDNHFGWVSANCLMEPEIDLEQKICNLTPCRNVKCVMDFNTTLPFLNNNSLIYQFPWVISFFQILGDDVTSEYSGQFSTYLELGEILEDGGWKQLAEDSSIYTKCEYRDEIPVDSTTIIKIMDNNNHIFFCHTIEPICRHIDDMTLEEMQLIIKTPGLGVMLGSPQKIFDAIPDCEDSNYTCTTSLPSETLFAEFPGVDSPPWKITELILGGQEQVVVPTLFSTLLQFQVLLESMGWISQGCGLYTISQILPAINTESSITIEGDTNTSFKFELDINCKLICDQEALNRVFLARDTEGNFCWASPACFNDCDKTCPTACCPEINFPDCEIQPKYDLKLILKKCLIEVIEKHLNYQSPYWIYSYKLSGGGQIVLEKVIDDPLSLTTLAQALIDLGWAGVVNGDPDEVELTLTGSCDLINGICINIAGNDGLTLPYSYIIPINCITAVVCPGLSSETKVLIRDGEEDPCFVDLDCIVPIVPPPIDLKEELCNFGDCDENPTYRICLTLDECDLIKIADTYGESSNLEIVEYQLVGTETCLLEPPYFLGNNLTIETLIDAFLDLGWTSPNVLDRPVELNLLTAKNINYVVINRVGANPNLPPYPFLLGANCSQLSDCPSKDPANRILIKNETDDLCWTPICPAGGFFVETGDTENGAALSGPFEVKEGETLRIWSAGGIFTNVVNGSAILEIEPNNILCGDGAPMDPPADVTRPVVYVNKTNNYFYYWNTENSGEWILLSLSGPPGEIGPPRDEGIMGPPGETGTFDSSGLSVETTLSLCRGEDHLEMIPGLDLSSNASISIGPKGTGFLSAQKPDNLISGGDCRGELAVDWQMKRSQSDQVASGQYSVIGGGLNNMISGTGSMGVICGGYQNQVHGNLSSIVGGYFNIIDESSFQTSHAGIGSGLRNLISGGNAGFVGGGYENKLNGKYSSIVGGRNNEIDISGMSNQGYALIGGGFNNMISGGHSSIVGGYNNEVKTRYALIGGGRYNTIQGGLCSFIGAGQENYVNGSYSSIIGGSGNYINGNNSVAMGRNADVDHHGCFIFSDNSGSTTTTTADNQFHVRCGGGAKFYGNCEITGKLTVGGLIDPTGLVLDEQSSLPSATVAGKGVLWVKDESPNTLMYTNDEGSTIDLSNAGNYVDGSSNVIIGDGAYGMSTNGVIIGTSAISTAADGIAIGNGSKVEGDKGIAIGYNVEATGSAIVIGYNVGGATGSANDGFNIFLGSQTGAYLRPGSGTDVVQFGNELKRKSSALRYKKDIILAEDLTDKIEHMQVKRFVWKEQGTPDIGMIAEDVDQYFSDIVCKNFEGECESVDYAKLSLPLIQEAQKQRQINSMLTSEIDLLKQEVSTLKQLVDNLMSG